MHEHETTEERGLHQKRANHYLSLIDSLFKMMMIEVERKHKKELDSILNAYHARYPYSTMSQLEQFAELQKQYPRLFTTVYGAYRTYVDFSELDLMKHALREHLVSNAHVDRLKGAVERYPRSISMNGFL